MNNPYFSSFLASSGLAPRNSGWETLRKSPARRSPSVHDSERRSLFMYRCTALFIACALVVAAVGSAQLPRSRRGDGKAEPHPTRAVLSPAGAHSNISVAVTTEEPSLLSECCKKTRAVVGYLRTSRQSSIEFNQIIYRSWELLQMIATTKGQNCKLDLIVFGEKSAERDHLPARCIKVELPAGQKLLQRLVRSTTSHCLFIPWGQDQLSTDIGYGYANSYHYMLSADVQRALAPYDLVLRTDFDVFLTPTLLETCPEKFTTGMGNYLGEGTEEKLVKVAQKLGYTHHGVQNIGSTWYGPPADIAKVAELSMSIMKHLLYNEFEQRPDGKGPLHMLDGVGWAEWYAGVSSMYSGEIAVQHVLGKDGFVKTNHMDTHSSSSEPMLDAWTIHCWHTEQLFSKFKLFDGAYQDFNLSTVDIGTMVGYSAHVALTPVLSSGLVEQVVESHEKQQHMQKSKQL